MALNSFITPKGSMCSVGITPQLNGSKILFGQNVESFGSPQEAQAYLNNVINTLNAYIAASGTAYVLDMRLISGYLLTGIYPRSVTFAWTGSAPQPLDLSTQITVFGLGFTPATCGFLVFEDSTGGEDSNGFFLRLVYVSPTVLVSDGTGMTGDATTSNPMLVYYQDTVGASDTAPAASPAKGNISNILSGVSSGTNPFTIYV